MDKFEEVLLRHRMDRFLVVDPVGGKGDQLIYIGMRKKLKELNITYNVLRYETRKARISKVERLLPFSNSQWAAAKKLEYVTSVMYDLVRKRRMMADASANVVLLRGGAYLNDIWEEYEVLERITTDYPDCDIIIGPHSFIFKSTRFSGILESSKQQIHVFCREKYSYSLLESMNLGKNIHIHLSHDTALYLSKDDFSFKDGSYDLICPRKDRESIVDWGTHPRAINQLQPSGKVIFGDLDRVRDFRTFVNLVGGARRVLTDRLHTAILSAVLGKATFLYPNCYYKNKGVYEYSLSRLSNVKFVDCLRFLSAESLASRF